MFCNIVIGRFLKGLGFEVVFVIYVVYVFLSEKVGLILEVLAIKHVDVHRYFLHFTMIRVGKCINSSSRQPINP